MRYSKLVAAGILFATIWARSACAAVPTLEQPIVDVLKEIAVTSNAQDRNDLVDQLERFVLMLRPDDISSSTIAGMTKLLDDNSDYVRWKVSYALGFLGPRASSAIPALKRALDKLRAENEAMAREYHGLVFGGITSGFTICQSLMILSSESLPADCSIYLR